jgi:hypothetical protein
MGLLNGDKSPNDIIIEKINNWLSNPPDYYDVATVYDELAVLKRDVVLLRRQIKKAEEEIAQGVEKPRSNEAKIAKIQATRELLDTLASLESRIEFLEMNAKKLEYQKAMFSSSSYALKVRLEIT